MSVGLYTHTTRGTGTVLTASIYNADHVNHITNQNPTMTGALADSVGQFQTNTDPGDIGTESLPSNLAGEIERLRYAIKRISGTAQWYSPPNFDMDSLAALVVAVGGGAPLVKTGNFTVTQTENSKSIDCDVSGGAFTITLPGTLTSGFRVRVRRNSATNTTALTIAAATLVNGVASLRLFGRYDYYDLEWNGSTWFAVLNGNDIEAVGTSKEWWLETPPSAKWILMHSVQNISRTTFSELFARWGTNFGVGDGTTTFGIPNRAGYFSRAWDNAIGVDPNAATRTDRGDGTGGDKVGTKQADLIINHTHNYDKQNVPGAVYSSAGSVQPAQAALTSTASGNPNGALGGAETRAKNIAVAYILKVLP